jgi:hypothetical protein
MQRLIEQNLGSLKKRTRLADVLPSSIQDMCLADTIKCRGENTEA